MAGGFTCNTFPIPRAETPLEDIEEANTGGCWEKDGTNDELDAGTIATVTFCRD